MCQKSITLFGCYQYTNVVILVSICYSKVPNKRPLPVPPPLLLAPNKRKKHVPIKPKQGFLATAVREFYSDLADVKHDDNNLSKALNLQKDALIGDERVDFWKELMSQNYVKTLKEVIRKSNTTQGSQTKSKCRRK